MRTRLTWLLHQNLRFNHTDTTNAPPISSTAKFVVLACLTRNGAPLNHPLPTPALAFDPLAPLRWPTGYGSGLGGRSPTCLGLSGPVVIHGEGGLERTGMACWALLLYCWDRRRSAWLGWSWPELVAVGVDEPGVGEWERVMVAVRVGRERTAGVMGVGVTRRGGSDGRNEGRKGAEFELGVMGAAPGPRPQPFWGFDPAPHEPTAKERLAWPNSGHVASGKFGPALPPCTPPAPFLMIFES